MLNKDTLGRSLVNDGKVATIKEGKAIVDAIFEWIASSLEDGDDVVINEFGKFKVVHREARKAKNPRTGEVVNVPEKSVVKFSASKKLKESV